MARISSGGNGDSVGLAIDGVALVRGGSPQPRLLGHATLAGRATTGDSIRCNGSNVSGLIGRITACYNSPGFLDSVDRR